MSTSPPTLDAVERLTLAILDRMNNDLPVRERIPLASSTIILGEGGLLDSLGIANFIVGMEEGLENEFGRSVPLSDQDLMDLFEEPSITVQGFAGFVFNRMKG